MIRSFAAVAGGVLALALVAPSSASAQVSIAGTDAFTGATSLDFEGYADNTSAATLYSPLGVTFSRDSGGSPVISDWGSLGRSTTSGRNVIATIGFSGYVGALNVHFATGQNRIGAYFGNDQSSIFRAMVLSVYDAADVFIGSVRIAANLNTSVDQFIGLQSDVAFSRARFEIEQSTHSYAVVADNLMFSSDGAAAGATVTPEPVSMALLGTGLAGLGAVRRRRRKEAGTA